MEIEINGLKYRQKEKNREVARTIRMVNMFMGMALMFSGQGNVGTSKKKISFSISKIIEEFGLIQKRKSLLSRRER